jgi:hypothetical protein
MGSCRIAPVARNAGWETVAWHCLAHDRAAEASYWQGHTPRMHLAQLNIGRLRAPIDDPVTDDFRMNLARINSIAEAQSRVRVASTGRERQGHEH